MSKKLQTRRVFRVRVGRRGFRNNAAWHSHTHNPSANIQKIIFLFVQPTYITSCR